MLFDTLDGGAVTAFYFPKFYRWRVEVRDAAGKMVEDGVIPWGGSVRWKVRETGEARYSIGDRF